MKHRDYFMLPNEIFSLGLKPRDFAVLTCLIRHKDNENDSCYPSRDLISKECCIKIKTVDAALKELEKRSLIVKKHRLRENGSHTSNMYFYRRCFCSDAKQRSPSKRTARNSPCAGFSAQGRVKARIRNKRGDGRLWAKLRSGKNCAAFSRDWHLLEFHKSKASLTIERKTGERLGVA